MELTITWLQTIVLALLSMVTIKGYFSFEGRKADRIEEGKEKRAEIYASGKIREARVEMQAETAGFNDEAPAQGGITDIVQMAIDNPELVKSFFEKKS